VDGGVVTFELALDGFQAFRKRAVGNEHLTQADEGAHYLHARLHGYLRIQHTRQHDGTVLREGIGELSPAATPAL